RTAPRPPAPSPPPTRDVPCSRRARATRSSRWRHPRRSGCAAGSSALLVGKGEVESAAASELALEPQTTAVQLDQASRYREAESRSVMLSRRRRIHLRELTEHEVVMLGRDADARVADLHEQTGLPAVRVLPRGDPHAAAGGCERDRVA